VPSSSTHQEIRLRILVRGRRLERRLNAAVGQIEIEAAVIVEVHESRTESREAAARHSQSHARGAIGEESILVFIVRVGLLPQIRHQNVAIAVHVVIGQRDSHSGLRRAVLIDRTSAQERFVDEAQIALIDPQLIEHGVVGDEQIRLAVGIEVRGHDSQSVAQIRGQPGGLGSVGERAVSVVAVERVPGRRFVVRGQTIVRLAEPIRTIELVRHRPIHVVRNEEIQIAVGVEIGERGRGSPRRITHSGGLSHVGEPPSPFVAQQHIGSVIRDEEIGIAVVIVVAHHTSHPVAAIRSTASFGRILDRYFSGI
jgi:hypothetical protein